MRLLVCWISFDWGDLLSLLWMASPHGGAHVTGSLVARDEPGQWSLTPYIWAPKLKATCGQQLQACQGSVQQDGQDNPPGAPPRWLDSSSQLGIGLALRHWHGWCPWIWEHNYNISKEVFFDQIKFQCITDPNLCISMMHSPHLMPSSCPRADAAKAREKTTRENIFTSIGQMEGGRWTLICSRSCSQGPSVSISVRRST